MNTLFISLLLSSVPVKLGKSRNKRIFYWVTFPQDASESTTPTMVDREWSHKWQKNTFRHVLTTAPLLKIASSGPLRIRTRFALWETQPRVEEGSITIHLATGSAAFSLWGADMKQSASSLLRLWRQALNGRWIPDLQNYVQTTTERPSAPWQLLQLHGWRLTSEKWLRWTWQQGPVPRAG